MNVEIDAVKMMHTATLHIRVKRDRELRWRLWIGARLIFLAARVMNCRIEVEELQGFDL